MKDKEQLKVDDSAVSSDSAMSQVFVHHSYEKLISTGVGEGVICDSKHSPKKLDIIALIVKSLSSYL